MSKKKPITERNETLKKPITERTIEGILKRIKASPYTTKYNNEMIDKMVAWARANGRDAKTIAKYCYCMERFLKLFSKKIDFNKIDREEMEQIIGRLNASQEYGDWIKAMVKIQVKMFWRHFYGSYNINGVEFDMQNPAATAWMKKIAKPKNKLKKADLLTEEEELALIKAATSDRNKCIIAVGCDLGLRIGETKIKVRDVNLEEGYIEVDGKTGKRTAWLSSRSIPYLTNFLNHTKKEPDDWLWTDYNGNILTGAAIYMLLKDAVHHAELKKKVWWHLLRHSRATEHLRNKVPIPVIKRQMGWSETSNVLETTYAHLADLDVKEMLLEPYGEGKPPMAKISKLKPINCSRCGKQCAADSTYCDKCGRALALEFATDIENVKSVVTSSIEEGSDLNKRIEELSRQVQALQTMQIKATKAST